MRPVFATLVVFLLVFNIQPVKAGEVRNASVPSSLSGTYWWVEDIDGQGVIDRSHTTIGFLEENRLAGDGACNRYTGAWQQNGNRLEFGPLASTRRACPEAIMGQDSRFHAAMARVVAFRVAATGLLYLLDDEGKPLIRAYAIGRDEQ